MGKDSTEGNKVGTSSTTKRAQKLFQRKPVSETVVGGVARKLTQRLVGLKFRDGGR